MALVIPDKPKEGWFRWATRNTVSRQLAYATLMQHLGAIAPFVVASFTHWLIGFPSVVHLGLFFLVYVCVGTWAIYSSLREAFNYLHHVQTLEKKGIRVRDEVVRKREADAAMENEIAQRQRESRQP